MVRRRDYEYQCFLIIQRMSPGYIIRGGGGRAANIKHQHSAIENLDGVCSGFHSPRHCTCNAGGWRRHWAGRPALRKVANHAPSDILGRVNHHAIFGLALRTNGAGNEARPLIGFGPGIRHTLRSLGKTTALV